MPAPLTHASRIAVLYGGMSAEREVSLRSGKNCLAALHRLGYQNAVKIDVECARTNRSEFLAQLSCVDVAFLALHGQYGEDGCIQGFLEILGIPYTGNGVKASALTMDKAFTKYILAASGLPVLPSVIFDTSNHAVMPTLERYPVMVKPLGEGSSIGMSKVNEAAALPAAIDMARPYSRQVLIEPYIQGLSVTVGVIDIAGEATATPILGFRTKTEWYDLAAKYTPGLTEFLLPAPLSPDKTAHIQQIALAAHAACGCTGLSRVDFILDADEAPYVLEINTIPGMTDLSDLPAQAKAMGIEYDALVETILKTAYPPHDTSC